MRAAASSPRSRAATTRKPSDAASSSTCAPSSTEGLARIAARPAHLEPLRARPGAGNEPHVARRDAERLGDEFRERRVRAILERGRLHADLQRLAMHARHLRALRAGLRVHAKDPASGVGGAPGHGSGVVARWRPRFSDPASSHPWLFGACPKTWKSWTAPEAHLLRAA